MAECTLDQGSGNSKVVVIGNSMYPTLRHLDLAYVTPVGVQGIRMGDVVVFNHECNCKKVVHRVISVDPSGIRTKGDGLTHDDGRITPIDQVLGKVELAQRDNRQRRIYGGKAGRLVGLAGHVYALLRACVRVPLWRIYGFLSRTRIFGAFVPPGLKPRVMALNGPSGVEYHLFMGRWIVGKRSPGRKRWKIRPPFRLFIDESALEVPGDVPCPSGVCKHES